MLCYCTLSRIYKESKREKRLLKKQNKSVGKKKW